jgi:predicted HicB family RNase H-like nuclease
MNKTKTHSLLVRGVSKSLKNTLKSEAKRKRQSVNSYMLTLLEVGIVTPHIKVENKNETL